MDFNTSRANHHNSNQFQTSAASKIKNNLQCCCDYHLFVGVVDPTLLNYSYSEDILDPKSPYDHDQDYGNTTVGSATVTPAQALRMGSSFIADTNIKLDSIYGYMTMKDTATATATLAICKVTPAIGISSNLTPVLLGEFILTSNDSNNEFMQVDSKSFSNINVSKGDIVFTMVKGSVAGDGVYWSTKLKFK